MVVCRFWDRQMVGINMLLLIVYDVAVEARLNDVICIRIVIGNCSHCIVFRLCLGDCCRGCYGAKRGVCTKRHVEATQTR